MATAKTFLSRVSDLFRFLFETPYNARLARSSEHANIHRLVAALSLDEIARFSGAAHAIDLARHVGAIILNPDVIILEALPEGDYAFDVTGRLFLFDKQSGEFASHLPVEMTGILYPNGEVGWSEIEVQA